MLQLTLLFFSIFKLFDAINILNLDYDLGTALGIGEFAGGIFVILILLFTFTGLPLWKRAYNIAFIFSMMILFFGVAVGWANIFCIIVILMAIAVGVAEKFTGVITSRLGR